MARERMVTRTVTATVAHVIGVEVSTAKAFRNEFTLTGTYKDNADILKTIKRKYDTEETIYATVIKVETKETLYGMSETDFLKYAIELPSRGIRNA